MGKLTVQTQTNGHQAVSLIEQNDCQRAVRPFPGSDIDFLRIAAMADTYRAGKEVMGKMFKILLEELGDQLSGLRVVKEGGQTKVLHIVRPAIFVQQKVSIIESGHAVV